MTVRSALAWVVVWLLYAGAVGFSVILAPGFLWGISEWILWLSPSAGPWTKAAWRTVTLLAMLGFVCFGIIVAIDNWHLLTTTKPEGT